MNFARQEVAKTYRITSDHGCQEPDETTKLVNPPPFLGMTENMTFGMALSYLKNRKRVTFSNWIDMWLELSKHGTKINLFRGSIPPNGKHTCEEWIPSTTELLTDNWCMIPKEQFGDQKEEQEL